MPPDWLGTGEAQHLLQRYLREVRGVLAPSTAPGLMSEFSNPLGGKTSGKIRIQPPDKKAKTKGLRKLAVAPTRSNLAFQESLTQYPGSHSSSEPSCKSKSKPKEPD